MASLGDLDETAAQRIGGSAAESVVASAAWSAAVGERYDTARVCAMLGVSRQALSKRQCSGTLIGLRGRQSGLMVAGACAGQGARSAAGMTAMPSRRR